MDPTHDRHPHKRWLAAKASQRPAGRHAGYPAWMHLAALGLLLIFVTMAGNAFAQSAPNPDWSLADMSSKAAARLWTVSEKLSGTRFPTRLEN